MNQNNNKKELFDEQDKKIFKAAGGIGAVWIGILIAIFAIPMIVFAILFFVMFNKISKLADEQVKNNSNDTQIEEKVKSPYVGKYDFERDECSAVGACRTVTSTFEILDDKNAMFLERDLTTEMEYKGTYTISGNKLTFNRSLCVLYDDNDKPTWESCDWEDESMKTVSFTIKGNDLVIVDSPDDVYTKQ